MTRDGMPRAYLRLDPNIDQTHPDLDAFVRLMCVASRQPERGRFRDRSVLDRAIGKTKVTRAMARGDVVTLPDGRLYLEGWDEWQEGDHTVAERMKRMRDRRKRHKTVTPVTPSASPDRNDVTTDAVAKELVGVVGVGDDVSPSPGKPGRREDGTNPRALGTNPRANASSPRQKRDAEKRVSMPESVHAILARAAKEGVLPVLRPLWRRRSPGPHRPRGMGTARRVNEVQHDPKMYRCRGLPAARGADR